MTSAQVEIWASDWIGRHIVHIPENRCDPLCCFALGAIQLSDDTAPPRSAPTKYYNNELYASNWKMKPLEKPVNQTKYKVTYFAHKNKLRCGNLGESIPWCKWSGTVDKRVNRSASTTRQITVLEGKKTFPFINGWFIPPLHLYWIRQKAPDKTRGQRENEKVSSSRVDETNTIPAVWWTTDGWRRWTVGKWRSAGPNAATFSFSFFTTDSSRRRREK